MFESHPGNVLFTLIEQIDLLAMFTVFSVQTAVVQHPAGGVGTFYNVIAETADRSSQTIFFSDNEKTAHNFRDLAEIGSVYFRNLTSH
ncbi:hypothetical protein FXO89_23030 [Salmonella enterica]|nr:hypothetical protein [Salmonella enterica]